MSPGLAKFLDQERAATVAVPIDSNGTIHAAALGYWHTGNPLRFYFVTDKATEKCRLLVEKGSVQAACVVGTVVGVDFCLQMRGQIKIVNSADFKETIDKYYAKRGNRHDDIDDPKNVLMEFTPTWARYTDYTKGCDRHMLDLGSGNNSN